MESLESKNKPNIRELSLDELKSLMPQMGEKPFRAGQLWHWLWKQGVSDFSEMLNLSKDFREKLNAKYTIGKVVVDSLSESSDGTVKYILKMADGNLVEGVLIPTKNRITACVSSQCGCSLSCKFCATGYLDLKRNLTHYEIFDQVQIIRDEAEQRLGRPLTNIVYMGMGEPLLNYRNVLESIARVGEEEGLAMSPKRITVSTAGIAKMIKKLGDDEVKFEFALSLHAANDEKRSKIMPINEHNSLEALGEALEYFYEKTHTRVTFEYIIFQDFNDSIQDALELYQFCQRVPCKVNVIEYNPISEANFVNTNHTRMDAFVQYLEKRGVIVNVRRSRGRDIEGACGQLALKQKK